MRYKTLFRMLLKVVGVWLIANGLVSLVGAIAQGIAFLSSGGFGGAAAAGFPSWIIAGLVAPIASIGFGLYLFFGGNRIVNLAIPSNRPTCPDCGYDLTSHDGERCTECGTVLPAPVDDLGE